MLKTSGQAFDDFSLKDSERLARWTWRDAKRRMYPKVPAVDKPF